jgi:hypothetical protein
LRIAWMIDSFRSDDDFHQLGMMAFIKLGITGWNHGGESRAAFEFNPQLVRHEQYGTAFGSG